MENNFVRIMLLFIISIPLWISFVIDARDAINRKYKKKIAELEKKRKSAESRRKLCTK